MRTKEHPQDLRNAGKNRFPAILEENKMASKRNSNLNNIKMQAANEVGVPLKDNGYNGDLTSRQAGSVGGQMVKTMMPKQRMGNQYYIPCSHPLDIRLCVFSLDVTRTLRKNISVDLSFNVYICI